MPIALQLAAAGVRRDPLGRSREAGRRIGLRARRPRGGLPLPAAALLAALAMGQAALGVEQVTFSRDGMLRTVAGQVIVEGKGGGLLLEERDGRLWAITADEVQERASDDGPFQNCTAQELSRQLRQELAGFQIHSTAHYVIAYNTSREYAEWCGAMFERLQRAFLNYWGRHGLDLQPPPPLVAIIFRDKETYEAYGREEVGDSIGSVIGYYSLRTNRIATYDLTSQAAGGRPRSSARIRGILALPALEHTVATVIHEAIHQLAYNTGLQRRYADIPMWLNEGLAIFFETPDLSSRRGWATIGTINRYRFRQFVESLPSRPDDRLARLLVDDEQFRNVEIAEEAYAEAWALVYYLIRTRPKEFVEYLQIMAQRRPLESVSAEQRLQEFRSVFGDDLAGLEEDLLRHMMRLK